LRIPLSWLREFVDVTLSAEELAEVLTFGGFETEEIHRPTAGVRGVVVAEVLDVAKVEGSDKLHLVHVSDGTDTHEIVCGASNYTPGDRVPAALPGAMLPGGFEIGRKKVFGVTSNGMLASARELGVGEDHRGIWILDSDAPLGMPLHEWLPLDDAAIEVAILPDRAYGLAILGIARDVAALTGAELRVPEAVAAGDVGGDTGVPVTIADPADCLRFDARRVEGVRIGPSPAWLQLRLAACGIRSISNVVDATNYAMLEVGHPVHAYDLATLAGPCIDVRRAAPGETLLTLDGVERTLHAEDLVIADADGPVGLAGVMGGARTEVGEATTGLLVEVASFDPITVSKAARRHKLFSEASTRFERTVPAESVPLGASRAAHWITTLAGGGITAASDTYPAPVTRPSIVLRPARARAHLGMDIDDATQQRLLASIDCAVAPASDGFAVVPPAYRPDIREEADLYEELARLYGYDHVPETLPSTGQVGGRTPEHLARLAVRRALAGGGWTEVLAFPFIADGEVDVLGLPEGDPRRTTIPLVNPLSAEESVLRTTLLPGLLRIVRHNVNRQTGDVAVFEMGHVFLAPTDEEPGAHGGPDGTILPAEPLMLGFAACGLFEPRRHDLPGRAADLYDLLGAVELVCRAVGLPPLVSEPVERAPFHPGRAARLLLDGREVEVVGELHPRVIEAADLPRRTLAGELRLAALVEGGIRPAAGSMPSGLPGLRFDVAVVVDEDVPAATVRDTVAAGAGERLTKLELFDVFRGEQLGEGRKSLAYALRLDDAERQLTTEDEGAAIAAIEAAVAAIGGHLRR
jgi:phenylalanyl-tRNA synthetase beta chain